MTDIAALVTDKIHIWTGAIQRKSGAGRGGGKRISLYGIERLRALILDLAVRGKLVPQDADDEPASHLLKGIAKSKAAMIRDGVIRKPREAEDKNHLKQPFSIPNTWQWVRLDQVGAIIGGGTPSSNDAACFADSGTGIAWLTPADLGGFTGRYIAHGARDLTDFGLRSSSATLMPAGSVLFTSRAPIGYVAIAEKPVATSQGFKSVVPFIGDCSLFIATALKSFAKGINDNAPGTTFKEVSGKIVSAIPFPLPPLAEQQRIVAKVDELMALCDALERESADAMAAHQALVEILLTTLVNSADATDLARQWARLERHFDILFTTDTSIDEFKSAIVELAVSGRLTNNGGTTFEKKLLRDLVIFGPKNGFSPRAVDYDTGIKSLSLSATTQGKFDGSHYKFVDIEMPNPDSELWLKDGDILIQRANSLEYVGVSALYLGSSNEFIYPDLMMKVRFSDDIESKFAAICMNSNSIRDYLRRSASGTSGSMPKINQTTLLNAALPVPPLDEQRRIVAKLNELMALCDALKARLADAAEIQRHLADVITERTAA